MTFKTSPKIPALPCDPPANIPIYQFMLEDGFSRHPISSSRNVYTCGLSGRSYTVQALRERVEAIATALGNLLSWNPNEGSQWDKVVAIFSPNSIDTIPVSWAAHRLSGIVTPANAAYTASEFSYQLKKSGAKVIFTCSTLLQTALEGAATVGIPHDRIFLLNIGTDNSHPGTNNQFRTVEELVELGRHQSPPGALHWRKSQGASQVAYICFSSGTTGLPKGVMISHRNIIANVLQLGVLERLQREPGDTQTALGLLPQSHIYALVVIFHACVYRGDEVVVLPKYELETMLKAITKYSINTLFLVPPILLDCLNNSERVEKHNLSCAINVNTGAASFSSAASATIARLFPNGILRQGYGLTETATVVSSSPRFDIFPGSSGILLPGVECKIFDEHGNEVVGYNQPGHVWVRSPSVALGYLNDEVATRETFGDNWLRTGDSAEFRISPGGFEHIFIIDRIKELIKVKGNQVAPAELEAQILQHPAVVDAAVIPVEDDRSGEVPKAFIVKSEKAVLSDLELKEAIHESMRVHKARYKWLQGGIEIRKSIPKSPSGKILRRELKASEKAAGKRNRCAPKL